MRWPIFVVFLHAVFAAEAPFPPVEGFPTLGRHVPPTFLDHSTGAACLDGSPYAFYFVPSLNNSTKWTVSIQGGGWCYNEEACHARSKGPLGSSNYFPKTSSCSCMNQHGQANDCNCIFMPYCDGASFSGHRPNPWPVPGPAGSVLWFRGLLNLDQTIQYAIAKLGMGAALELVVTGGSAGGLSTFLHTDRVSARVRQAAPQLQKVRAAPVVGFFLDHADFAHDSSNYTAYMKYIYHMQALSAGALLPECLAAFPAAPHYCFMSPHMQRFVKTPFFMFNSKYDSWQLRNILQVPCYYKDQHPCPEHQQQAVLQYGRDFMNQFAVVRNEHRNGAFITSCVCHGCPWPNLVLEGKSAYAHYAAWLADDTTGPQSIHIDTRAPNGGGVLKNSECSTFP